VAFATFVVIVIVGIAIWRGTKREFKTISILSFYHSLLAWDDLVNKARNNLFLSIVT